MVIGPLAVSYVNTRSSRTYSCNGPRHSCHNPRSPARLAARFHGRQSAPRHRPARHSDDSRDADGIAVRRRRHVLRGAAGRGFARHGRVDGIVPRAGIRHRHGAEHGHYGVRRAAHRRERSGGRGGGGGAGDRGRIAAGGAGRRSRDILRAERALHHGREPVGHQNRFHLHAHSAGRVGHDLSALPDQRHLPGRGRRGAGHARALAREHHQYRARPVPHQRLGTVSAAERDGGFGRHHHRTRAGRGVPALDSVRRQEPDPGRTRIRSASTLRCCGGCCGCRSPASCNS